jgi:hypothetical protein
LRLRAVFFPQQPAEGSRLNVFLNRQAPADLSIAELELELIQTQMTQKPMLRAEVYARALRASQNRKEDSV